MLLLLCVLTASISFAQTFSLVLDGRLCTYEESLSCPVLWSMEPLPLPAGPDSKPRDTERKSPRFKTAGNN